MEIEIVWLGYQTSSLESEAQPIWVKLKTTTQQHPT
jgi:hypothetical protein